MSFFVRAKSRISFKISSKFPILVQILYAVVNFVFFHPNSYGKFHALVHFSSKTNSSCP